MIYIVFPFARQCRASDEETPRKAPEDIHIFWWQACAEPLEKSLKYLIGKHNLKTRQVAAGP
ncbi:hypothetical protein, partial [Herbaspirillum sp. YR522]|uniref:hypothetical protein n=1 Tax=Herbaspirillum sp. YR522 TaxID=1144342 RepID=UPI001EE68559